MYHFSVDDDDLHLLGDLLAATAGGSIDLIHEDDGGVYHVISVLVESVTNGLVNARTVNEDGEPIGDTFPIDLGSIRQIDVW